MPQRILITAQGPLAFPARKPDTQFAQSLGYVPGIALWGALGAQLQGIPRARFAHALPARHGDPWVRVLPVTAMSCKRHAGFRQHPAAEREQHGVFDTLIDRACWEVLRPAAFTYDPHCPVCQGRPDAFTGFYAEHRELGARFQKREVAQRLLTRVAIDRQRGAAAESQLYSPLAIAEVTAYGDGSYEATRFLGLVWGLDARAHTALEQVDVLGARRSSGLGRVKIELLGEADTSDLAARLHAFNETFRARWAVMQSAASSAKLAWDPAKWTVFSVGLQSDAVLLEDGWRPSLVLSPAQLPAELPPATLVRSWASARALGGWSLRWNRHRPTVLAVPAGSTYLFRSQASAAEVAAALATLEESGIGERRAEGYGAVRCCDEFHTQAIGEAV